MHTNWEWWGTYAQFLEVLRRQAVLILAWKSATSRRVPVSTELALVPPASCPSAQRRTGSEACHSPALAVVRHQGITDPQIAGEGTSRLEALVGTQWGGDTTDASARH